jgi:hypothetical protein
MYILGSIKNMVLFEWKHIQCRFFIVCLLLWETTEPLKSHLAGISLGWSLTECLFLVDWKSKMTTTAGHVKMNKGPFWMEAYSVQVFYCLFISVMSLEIQLKFMCCQDIQSEQIKPHQCASNNNKNMIN